MINRSSSLVKHAELYHTPRWLQSGHLQTVYPMFMRRLRAVSYRRERIGTSDGDFLDLDWVGDGGSKRLVVISHGLEGSSRSGYVRGMARAFLDQGWDALAWNYRGCSGEVNLRPRSYHAGATEDLDTVVSHAISLGYHDIVLIGFSLGGNLTLKYLGERGGDAPAAVRGGIAFSVPCDLGACAEALSRPANAVYQFRFMHQLRGKIRKLEAHFPGEVGLEGLAARTFREFDSHFTARLHGFEDAEAYWKSSSSRQFLPGIRRPTLLVNALDDPFLPRACYPAREAGANPALTFETPRHGGHVGFVRLAADNLYWSELRALEFASHFCGLHPAPTKKTSQKVAAPTLLKRVSM
ncbi:MAG: alpha/beta fold hydrolase [Rhodothermales bacterium]|nr:alpha/beta fold hydrolase [Rhodothermales bacterium]